MTAGEEVEYLEKNQNDLDIIRPLWDKLNAHHITVSKYFKDNPRGDYLRYEEKTVDGKVNIRERCASTWHGMR